MRSMLVPGAILGSAVLIFAATVVALDHTADSSQPAAAANGDHLAMGETAATAKGASFAGAAPANAEIGRAHV